MIPCLKLHFLHQNIILRLSISDKTVSLFLLVTGMFIKTTTAYFSLKQLVALKVPEGFSFHAFFFYWDTQGNQWLFTMCEINRNHSLWCLNANSNLTGVYHWKANRNTQNPTNLFSGRLEKNCNTNLKAWLHHHCERNLTKG